MVRAFCFRSRSARLYMKTKGPPTRIIGSGSSFHDPSRHGRSLTPGHPRIGKDPIQRRATSSPPFSRFSLSWFFLPNPWHTPRANRRAGDRPRPRPDHRQGTPWTPATRPFPPSLRRSLP
jgi:hypothetical protein